MFRKFMISEPGSTSGEAMNADDSTPLSPGENTGTQPAPGPPSGLPAELAPHPGSRRRRTWIAGSAAAAVVILAVVLAVSLSGSSGSGATSQFEKAYAAFHSRFGTESAALNGQLRQAGDGFGDPFLAAAESDARDLAVLYHNYGRSVAAISMPANAKAGASRLIRDAAAGQFLMSQSADFFIKPDLQQLLNTEWPLVTTQLTKAETTVRKALGITT
jgi:hypothetical protein